MTAMELLNTVILSCGGSAVLIIGLSNWLGEVWARRLMDKEKAKLEEFRMRLEHDLSNQLEAHKRELDLQYEDQNRRRKLYEELSDVIEEILIQHASDYALALNKVFGRLALYAPDEVYRAVRNAIPLDRIVPANEVRPVLYCALPKSLFGDATLLVEADIAQHITGAKGVKMGDSKSGSLGSSGGVPTT